MVIPLLLKSLEFPLEYVTPRMPEYIMLPAGAVDDMKYFFRLYNGIYKPVDKEFSQEFKKIYLAVRGLWRNHSGPSHACSEKFVAEKPKELVSMS